MVSIKYAQVSFDHKDTLRQHLLISVTNIKTDSLSKVLYFFGTKLFIQNLNLQKI